MSGSNERATIKCVCGKVYSVRWGRFVVGADSLLQVYGLPIECACGVRAEQLEQQARLSPDEDDTPEERLDDIRGNSPAYRAAMTDAGRGRLL